MTPWALTIGLLVALATASASFAGPRRRAPTGSVPSIDAGRRASSRWRREWRGRRRDHADAWLGPMLVEVASHLRAGASLDAAWSRALRRAGLDARPGGVRFGSDGADVDDGVPPVLASRAGSSPALDAAIAACRLARSSGTPLADVLETCAAGVVEANAAAGARRIALAGPTSTARILGWLPVVSLVAGTALGSDPIGVLLGGGLGLVALVVGSVLVVAGRRWTAALVAAAEREGSR